MNITIRRMGIGEVLDISLTVLKDHLGLFVGIFAVIQLPVLLAMGWLNVYSMPKLEPGAGVQEWFAAWMEASNHFLGARYALTVLALVVCQPVTYGAITYATAQCCLGKTVTLAESLMKGFRLMFPLFIASIILGFALMLGLAVFIIGIFFVALIFGLVNPVIVLEGANPVRAFVRSQELMRQHLGALFVLSLVVMIMQFLLMTVPAMIPELYTQTFFSSLLQCVVTPLGIIVTTVFYISCRCRHEHFDLIQIAREISTAPLSGESEAAPTI